MNRPDLMNLINKFYKQETSGVKSSPNRASGVRKDSVEFSATMDTLKKEMARLEEKDGVRAAKVADLNRRIETGEYEVDPREIADILARLVNEKRL